MSNHHAALTAVVRCAALLAVFSVPSDAQTPPPANEGSAPAAWIGDRVVTLAEVDRLWQRAAPAEYAQAMQRTYDARRKFLDLLVAEEVIAREAQARGVTIEQFLADELPRHLFKTSESDVEAMYRALGDQAKGATLEQMRPALRAYLERRGPDSAKTRLVEELMRTSTRVRVVLEPPRIAFERTEQDAVLGPMAALVEIVVFGDFQNPSYVDGAQALALVRETFGDKVRTVFKSLPTAGQPIPITAAAAGQCAKAQGKFWPYHDALLAHPMRLDPEMLKRDAASVGLNRRAFDECLEGGAARAVVERAIDEAARYGVAAAPKYFVNGRPVPDPPAFSVLKRLIEEELMRQSRTPSPAAR